MLAQQVRPQLDLVQIQFGRGAVWQDDLCKADAWRARFDILFQANAQMLFFAPLMRDVREVYGCFKKMVRLGPVSFVVLRDRLPSISVMTMKRSRMQCWFCAGTRCLLDAMKSFPMYRKEN